MVEGLVLIIEFQYRKPCKWNKNQNNIMIQLFIQKPVWKVEKKMNLVKNLYKLLNFTYERQ